MPRMWYLSRDSQVFGPVTDEQLAQSAAAGRILPTDQLNVAGEPNWLLASAIPGLFPAPAPPPPLAPVPVPAPEPLPLDSEPLSLEPLSLDPDPELLPLEPVIADLLPVDAVVVASRTVRVTCFACFREVSVEVAPGASSGNCPKCRATVETGEPVGTAPAANANQAAFAALESPAAFKERMQKKVAEAQAAAGRDGAILGGVLGAVIPG